MLLKIATDRKKCAVPGAIYIGLLAIVTFEYNNIACQIFMTYFLCFTSGVMVVYYDMYDQINKLEMRNVVFSIFNSICWVVVVGARAVLINTTAYDYLIAPIFAYGLAKILKRINAEHIICKILSITGKYSIYIWLTHTFFAYYFVQKIVFAPKISCAIFLLCSLLALGSGVILEKIYLLIQSKVQNFQLRRNKNDNI